MTAYVQPIARYVFNMLGESDSSFSTATELHFADLTKLPGEEIGKICVWLIEKVDAIASGHAQVMLQIDTQLKVWHPDPYNALLLMLLPMSHLNSVRFVGVRLHTPPLAQ